jgi:hypothetical protein
MIPVVTFHLTLICIVVFISEKYTYRQISVWTYLFLGILCLDQLGPEAFVPNNNDRKIASNHLPREISQRSQNSANSNNIASDPSGRNFGRDGSNVRRNTTYV